MSVIKKLWFEEGLYPDEDYDFLDIDETELGNYDFFDLDEDASVVGEDDGVFNFGDIDEGDETAEGDYDMNQDTPPPPDPTDISVDFMDEDEWYEEHKNEEAKHIDFTDETEWFEENEEFGYDNFDFANIDQEEEPFEYSYKTSYPCDEDREDDHLYEFGDIDDTPATAEGDYDMNMDVPENVRPEDPDDGKFDWGEIQPYEKDVSYDFVDEDEYYESVADFRWENYDFYNIDNSEEDIDESFQTVPAAPGDPDDGVYNFGDIDEEDESAVGDYDMDDNPPQERRPDEPDDDYYNFGDIDETPAPEKDRTDETDADSEWPENRDYGDADIEEEAGEEYAEAGTARGDWDMMENPIAERHPLDIDEGEFNFGDIDLDDETAVGDYDYGDAEDDEEYKFDFTDADEVDLWPSQFDIDYDFGECELIGFQQTKDFLIKAFQDVIADMTHDPDFEVSEKDIEDGLNPYMKFQYWYNERTNKSFIQFEFFNQNHNQIIDKHALMDRVTARIKSQFKYDTGIVPEIVNIREKEVVPDNRMVITPYIIGYWESLNGRYETIEDRAEIALDMRRFTDPDYVTDEAAYDLGDYFKHRSNKFIEFYDITKRISNTYNLKIRTLSIADQDAYMEEYREILKRRDEADFPDLLAELNERYSNNNYTNENIPDAFNEYWDEYNNFFGYKLPSVYYYTRRCNVVIKNIA